MNTKDQRGIGLVSTILVLTFAAMFLAAVGLVLSQERARVRDAKRIVDMIKVQYAFETLYREKASYIDAASGCAKTSTPVSTCALSTYLPGITAITDPGKYVYQVVRVPDDQDFGVSFTLERGYESLVKGVHILSKGGIQ